MAKNVQERLRRIHDELAQVCSRCGRDPKSLRIVAVSKTQSVWAIGEAHLAGLADFGENRVQEAEAKILQIQPRPIWHLVGHLQTNKAHRAALLFDWVQSVDSVRVAEALGRAALEADKTLGVLVQVNTTAEGQKSGCDPGELEAVIGAVLAQSSLHLAGIMTIGPVSMEETATRRAFELARQLRETWRRQLAMGTMDVLSMGMSGDWPWAVEHGADWLRLGTAIFGTRTA